MITFTQWQFGVYSKGFSLKSRSVELLRATPFLTGSSLPLRTSVSLCSLKAMNGPEASLSISKPAAGAYKN